VEREAFGGRCYTILAGALLERSQPRQSPITMKLVHPNPGVPPTPAPRRLALIGQTLSHYVTADARFLMLRGSGQGGTDDDSARGR
jgi:hypothetical protein